MSLKTPVPLRQEYGKVSAAVAGVVDPRVESFTPDVNRDTFVAHLRRNKLSREFLKKTNYDLNGVSADKSHRESRTERLELVTDWFDDADVEYVPMKNLRTPKSMMSDIDFLVPDPSEAATAVRLLDDAGYELHRFRLLAHPLKTMAVAPEDTGESTTGGAHDWPVDLYPDAIWIRKRVCDPDRVVERAAANGELTSEDDLYLIATHAYSHLSVTFGELYHGVLVLEESNNIDWEYLLEIADEYGCADALYLYLRSLDDYLTLTGRDSVPPYVFQRLEEYRICRSINGWYDRGDTAQFPVPIPIRFACAASVLHHVPRVARHSSLRETWKDFQSHLLVAASKLILGET